MFLLEARESYCMAAWSLVFFFLQLRKTSLLGHSYIKDRWLCVRQTDKNIYAIVALLASDFFLIMLTDLGEMSC